MSEKITPIEYVQGDYAIRDDVVVWWCGSLVADVRWHDESTYTREGYNVYCTYQDCIAHRVDTYDHCLRVEPADHEHTRQQLRDIVELIPDENLLEHLEDLRQCVVWEKATE